MLINLKKHGLQDKGTLNYFQDQLLAFSLAFSTQTEKIQNVKTNYYYYYYLFFQFVLIFIYYLLPDISIVTA